MKTTTLVANTFIKHPKRGYASFISNHEQLKIKHNHDYFEIFIVSSGNANHYINGRSMPISTGDLFLIRPPDVHYYDDLSSKFRIINMVVIVETMNDLFQYLGDGFDKERLLSPVLPPMTHIEINELGELISDFEQLVLSKKVMKEKSDTFFRIVLFNIISKLFPVEPITQIKNIPEWLQWLTLEMQKKENFKQGLDALYSLSGRSEAHVSRMCKKHLNKTPTQLINEIRLDYAVKLLVGTNKTATEISESVGFDSLSHFYHLFKSGYGIPPNEYRKNVIRQSASVMKSENEIDDRANERTIQEGVPIMPIIDNM